MSAPTVPRIEDLDLVFRGFADPTRIRILSLLVAGQLCVCDIVDILGLPQPVVSRHLAYLRRMGLVEVTREWKFAYYRLARPQHRVHQTLLDCTRECFRGVEMLDAERGRGEAVVKSRLTNPC